MVRKLAGYSLGRGDLVRRIMGKKKEHLMKPEREVFLHGNKTTAKVGETIVPGCIASGIDKVAAETIWNKMAQFAKYAFNKSHSAGYAAITVQTAWMKYYYPTDFIMASINSVIDKTDKLNHYIASARKDHIELLGPDVNKSEELYTIESNKIHTGFTSFLSPLRIEPDKIRTGLKGLRNVGKMAAPIIQEKNKNGEFTSIENFIDRMINDINKKVLEALIYSGALDCFEGNRKSKAESVPAILEFVKDVKNGSFDDMWFNLNEVDDLYLDLHKIKFEESEEFEQKLLLEKEYEYTGMFISGHPLDMYEDFLELAGNINVKEILPEVVEGTEEIEESKYDGQAVTVSGIIRDLKQIITKNGQKMYMCKLEDKTGTIKCVVFPKTTTYCEEFLIENSLITFSGKVEDNERGCQLIVSGAKEIEDMKKTLVKTLWIDGRGGFDIDLLKEMVDENPGKIPVKVYTKSGIKVYKDKVNLDWETFMKFKEKFNVKLT